MTLPEDWTIEGTDYIGSWYYYVYIEKIEIL